jgi:hypothetical protein
LEIWRFFTTFVGYLLKNKLKTSLKEIAVIQTGVFARTKSSGEVVYLQAKDFDQNGSLTAQLQPGLRFSDVSQKHLLIPGDILFAAKGSKNFAAVYESHNQPAVASTSFFVIRLITGQCLPGFLGWYLNSQPALSFLKELAKGTSIPSISKQVLESVVVPLPPLAKQQTILDISALRKRETSLQMEIETLKEKQIQQLILNVIR